MLQERALVGRSMVLWGPIDVGSTPLVSSSFDFTESIVDDKTEMSQDELRFMQNAKETVKLKDSHYQICLPFNELSASHTYGVVGS